MQQVQTISPTLFYFLGSFSWSMKLLPSVCHLWAQISSRNPLWKCTFQWELYCLNTFICSLLQSKWVNSGDGIVLDCGLEAIQSRPLGGASRWRKWDTQLSSVWGIPLESLGKWSPRERQQRREMDGSLSTNKGQIREAGRWSPGKVRKSEEFWYISAPFGAFSGSLLGFPEGPTINNPPAMQETQVWSLGQDDPLEEGMSSHSSIPAWRIPWTEVDGPWCCKEWDMFQWLSTHEHWVALRRVML